MALKNGLLKFQFNRVKLLFEIFRVYFERISLLLKSSGKVFLYSKTILKRKLFETNLKEKSMKFRYFEF